MGGQCVEMVRRNCLKKNLRCYQCIPLSFYFRKFSSQTRLGRLVNTNPLRDLLDHFPRFLDVRGNAIIKILSSNGRFGCAIPNTGRSEFRHPGAREFLPTHRAYARPARGNTPMGAVVRAKRTDERYPSCFHKLASQDARLTGSKICDRRVSNLLGCPDRTHQNRHHS
jgi:hypothetical protein